MAAIYKFGFSRYVTYDDAVAEAEAKVREMDDGPIVETGVLWNEEHVKNEEFLVKIVTGDKPRG